MNLVGKTLNNRYRVDNFIGRGGMAEVYRVWDFDRATYLALKLLREDLAQDRIFLRRFQREAQTLAKLQHPNIVRSYGLERDGLMAFMLMGYVDGTSLRSEIFNLDGHAMRAQRISEIMQPICSALHYAHRSGTVHCDLKPGNVMIHQNGTVLVTDFGIARMMDAATATMVGMGTPAYMAPEQIRGKDPTPQTDIYALGIVLYEMLTGGERPFTGERADTTGTTSDKVRWEHIHLEPPSPRRWNQNISQGLELLLMKCLSKDPEDRYDSVLDILNDLERLISPESAVVTLSPQSLKAGETISDGEEERIAEAKEQEPQIAQKVRPWWKHWVAWILLASLIIVIGGFALLVIGNRLSSSEVLLQKPSKTSTAHVADTQSTNSIAESSTPSKTSTITPTPISTSTSTPSLPVIQSENIDQLIPLYSIQTDTARGWGPKIAFSPDGSMLAVSERGGKTVRLWDIYNAQEIYSFSGHRDVVTVLAFSPDGKILASGSIDDTLILWNVKSGNLIRTLKGHTNDVLSAAFSPDGEKITTSGRDKSINIWDVETGDLIHTLGIHGSAVYSISFSPDGTLMATGSYDSRVRIWDTRNWHILHTLTGQNNSSTVWDVGFSQDGEILVSTNGSKGIFLWDVTNGTLLSFYQDYGSSFAGSPIENIIAIYSYSISQVQILELDIDGNVSEIGLLSDELSGIREISFSPDGKMIATVDRNGEIILWGFAGSIPNVPIVATDDKVFYFDHDMLTTVIDSQVSHTFNAGEIIEKDARPLKTLNVDLTANKSCHMTSDTLTGGFYLDVYLFDPNNTLILNYKGSAYNRFFAGDFTTKMVGEHKIQIVYTPSRFYSDFISTENHYEIEEDHTVISQLTLKCETPHDDISSTPSPTQSQAGSSTSHPETSELDIGATQVSPVDGMAMVYIPAGEFEMGSSDAIEACENYSSSSWYRSKCEQWVSTELPQHLVYLDEYLIDQTEVTNAMYANCVDAGECAMPTLSPYFSDQDFSNHPVMYVSWYHARDYCEWSGRRLPTEAEWEKAARGLNEYNYPWGNDFHCSKGIFINKCSNHNEIMSVGLYPSGASPFTVLDIAGNVWEWVADWYAGNYYYDSPQNDPQGPPNGTYRSVRGGWWNFGERSFRSTARSWENPEAKRNLLGFRCAMDSN